MKVETCIYFVHLLLLIINVLTYFFKPRLVMKEMTNGATNSIAKYWEQFVKRYADSIGSYFVQYFNFLYAYITINNAVLVVFKYLPMAIYMKKFVRKMYTESQERMKQRNREIDDILLKIEIVNAKISCREAESVEPEKRLKYWTEQLRIVRAQVRHMIANNDELRSGPCLTPVDFLQLHLSKTDEKPKQFEDFLREVENEQADVPSEEKPMNYDNDNNTTNDVDDNNYNIKIVKVTNVYEMSYLQHYLKLKRLQRTKRHAILKKQINKTKKILNDWHRTLKSVTNNRSQIEITSEEAMGDYNKACELSDCEFEESADSMYEDYGIQNENQYVTYKNSYCDNTPENVTPPQVDTRQIYHNRCNYQMIFLAGKQSDLGVLPEETSSEVEIERLDMAA